MPDAALTAPFEQQFAHDIYKQKYAHPGEEWEDTAKRVSTHVLAALYHAPTRGPEFVPVIEDATGRIERLIADRRFMPGGRYLYATGRALHQTQNCLLLRAEDSREGWADLQQKAAMALMTGAGIGVWYGDVRPAGSTITRTGGVASGPVSLMQIINEIGRHTMQGGSRRSAIWAGLPWWHADVDAFIRVKDYPAWLREQKAKDHTVAAPLDMTNISVTLDDDFFEAYENQSHPDHERAVRVYRKTVDKMLTTAEPGFSVDTGAAAGEVLRNAPLGASTRIIAESGVTTIGEVANTPVTVWTGKQWADDVVFKRTAEDVPTVKVRLTGGREIVADPTHEFVVERYVGAGDRRRLDRVEHVPAAALSPGDVVSVSLPETLGEAEFDARAYTLGYAYGDGSFTDSGLDITFCTDESKACAAHCVEPRSGQRSDSRGYSRFYYDWDTAGLTKDRLAFDGSRESAYSLVAGLFDADGNCSPDNRLRLSNKSAAFLADVRALLEWLGVMSHVSKNGSSTYGDGQTYQLVVAAGSHDDFCALVPCKRVPLRSRTSRPYRDTLVKVVSVEAGEPQDVYCADVGVEEHTFAAEGVLVRNCTEVTSADDSDVCNLGSLVLSRFDDPADFERAVSDAVLFLTAGTLYSDLPYDAVHVTREKNRRLGLGVMGVHEFCLRRGVRYGSRESMDAMRPFAEAFARAIDHAHNWQDQFGLSRSVAATAIAPTGTIGIVAETTTGIEPIFAAAYERAVIDASTSGDVRRVEYVVDPTARRLVEDGVDPELIEDAYSLSYDYERRFAMQHFWQRYTDHGISSTVNLPRVVREEDEQHEFGDILMRYLPELRGITCYPDGARPGQPLVAVPIEIALASDGYVVEEDEEKCVGGVCGV